MTKKYFKINLASPKKILKWTERSLPNGELIGKVTKPMRIICCNKINFKFKFTNIY